MQSTPLSMGADERMPSSASEAELWDLAGVTSISALEGFPFATHQEFVEAVQSKQYFVGIDYAVARRLAHISKSQLAHTIMVVLLFAPALLVIATLVVAVASRSWLALLGVVVAPLGWVLASPYNPIRNLGMLIAIGSLAYSILSGHPFAARSWIALCFGTSFMLLHFLNASAWNWSYAALLRSEAYTALLWTSKSLHLRHR